MRVAWVDDEPTIRYLACRMVQVLGGIASQFEDHASLLRSEDGPFDAAILQPTDDVPADETRAELRRRGVRIVLLASGDPADDMTQRGIDLASFDGFLAKPFGREDIAGFLGLDAPRPPRRAAS
jgi:CheY-like chemotaxis protein